MNFLRFRRGIVVIGALLLLLFLFRPGVNQLRKRIAGSLSSALTRKVTIDGVSVHLLPRPGFGLNGVVIYDGPAFSNEPMVSAPEISAAIRLRSLLRGRLEIATLSAAEPSINLVRNDQGRWNLAALLERSAQVPTVPVNDQARRPAFPYLEATQARINFKLGQAKKSWSLTNADVALWQASENSWGARMTAQPIRTDFNLTDTGLVRINASWERAANITDTPVKIAMRWENGQLGEVTKLFSGRDRGWRGDLDFTASVAGTPHSLQISSQIHVNDFRRYNVLGTQKVRLASTCTTRYDAIDREIRDLSCESPVNEGFFRLTGNASMKESEPSFDVALIADKIPLAAALLLVQQTKKDLPADLVADGRLDAEFHAIKKTAYPVEVQGKGLATNSHLAWNGNKDQIEFGEIPLVLESRAKTTRSLNGREPGNAPPDTQLRFGPFPLALGAPNSALASASLSISGYRFSLRGDTEIQSLYRLTNALGIVMFHPTATGFARVDTSVYGSWQGFESPIISGTAQLRNVQTGMRGLNPPIQIASASMRLEPTFVSLEKVSASIDDTHWSGSVKAPRPCVPERCIFEFDLAADTLSSNKLLEWFTPHPAKRPWYHILATSEPQGKSPLLTVQAQGNFRLGRFGWKKAEAKEIASEVDLDHGKLTLTNLKAQLFEGTHQGNWVIDTSVQPPAYQAKGTLQNIALADLSAATGNPWASGTADASFELAGSGSTVPDVLSRAEGDLRFTMRNGAFAHLRLPDGSGPFPVHTFTATLHAKSGFWKLGSGLLESHDGVYRVTGNVSAASALNVQFTRGDALSWNITGTLLKPRVAHATRTEAKN